LGAHHQPDNALALMLAVRIDGHDFCEGITEYASDEFMDWLYDAGDPISPVTQNNGLGFYELHPEYAQDTKDVDSEFYEENDYASTTTGKLYRTFGDFAIETRYSLTKVRAGDSTSTDSKSRKFLFFRGIQVTEWFSDSVISDYNGNGMFVQYKDYIIWKNNILYKTLHIGDTQSKESWYIWGRTEYTYDDAMVYH
jgi:hypothetical protein